MSNGKGSSRRPCEVSREQFEANWGAAFGKKTERYAATLSTSDVKRWVANNRLRGDATKQELLDALQQNSQDEAK